MKAFSLTFNPVNGNNNNDVTFSAAEDAESRTVTISLVGAQEAPVTLGAEDAAVLYTSMQYLFDTIRRRTRNNQPTTEGRPRREGLEAFGRGA